MKKTILGTAIALAALSLQSCLHDNEELFEKSAAERIEEAVAADKQLLESADNGWQMHFYTGEQYTGGGYTMFMKFKNGKAYVSSDIAPANMVTTSSYDVTKDQGPVLTFNTYNTIMHYLSQPYSGDVDGEQGDYEFVIMKTTQDSIYVKGKKWKNEFVMTRIPSGQDWAESISKMHANLQSMRTFTYLPSGSASASDLVTFDPSSRRVYVGDDTTVGTPFFMTTEGVGFQSPVTISGKAVSELKLNAAALTFTSTDGSLILNGISLPGYTSIDDFVGNWAVDYTTDYSGKKADQFIASIATTSALIDQKSYSEMVMTVPSSYSSSLSYDLGVTYSPLTGQLGIPAQYIKDPSGSYPYLMVLAVSPSGYLSYSTLYIGGDANGQLSFQTDSSGSKYGLVFVAVDSQGSPYYADSNGNVYTYAQAEELFAQGYSLSILVAELWYNLGDVNRAQD